MRAKAPWMTTLFCFVLAASCFATDPVVDQPPVIEIIGPDEVDAGDLVILTADVPDGADLDWKITPPEAVSRMYVDTSGKTAVFSARAKGQYVFSLAVAHENQATCVVHVLQNGVRPDPEPEPEPEPDPEPNPEPGKRFVLVVAESETQDPDRAAVLMAVRDYATEKGHSFRFTDPDAKDRDGKIPTWFAAYAKIIGDAKISGPVMVVGALDASGKSVTKTWVVPLAETPEAAVEAIKQHGG